MEFYLEEGITDEEAVSLIDLEVPRADKKTPRWQEMNRSGILLPYTCAHTMFVWLRGISISSMEKGVCVVIAK